MSNNTKAILKELYPLVEKNINKKTIEEFKKLFGQYINRHSAELYEVFPMDRIYFTEEDSQIIFKAFNIQESVVDEIITKTYFHKISNFNPRQAKKANTAMCICLIRYLYNKKMTKELELAMIYFIMSMYASIHYKYFKKVQPREYEHVCLYVVNNELTQKFDIKREGHVFGAVRSICNTWVDTYTNKLDDFDDEDYVYLVQQLNLRLNSFMKNLADLYYKAYSNRDMLTFDSDNFGEDNYRIADTDALKIERHVETSMNTLMTSSVDYKICKMCADSNIKTDEIKGIIESILDDNDNLTLIKELLTITVAYYMTASKEKDIRDMKFITTTLTPKPNTKDKYILRQKEIITNFLDENSAAYRKRKSRLATQNSYIRAVLMYFTLITYESNKK